MVSYNYEVFLFIDMEFKVIRTLDRLIDLGEFKGY